VRVMKRQKIRRSPVRPGRGDDHRMRGPEMQGVGLADAAPRGKNSNRWRLQEDQTPCTNGRRLRRRPMITHFARARPRSRRDFGRGGLDAESKRFQDSSRRGHEELRESSSRWRRERRILPARGGVERIDDARLFTLDLVDHRNVHGISRSRIFDFLIRALAPARRTGCKEPKNG